MYTSTCFAAEQALQVVSATIMSALLVVLDHETAADWLSYSWLVRLSELYSSVQVYGGRYPNIPPYTHVHAHDFSSTLPRSAAVLSDYYYNCRHIMNQDQLVRIQYSTDLALQ